MSEYKFCEDCRWLEKKCVNPVSAYYGEEQDMVYRCTHPSNLKEVHCWLERMYKRKKHPSKLNKKNDCVHRESKCGD